MKSTAFDKLVFEHLATGAVVAPLVGTFGRLRIAAGVIRAADETSGVMLIANDRDPDPRRPLWDATCLRRGGRAALDPDNRTIFRPWEVRTEVATRKIVALAGRSAAEALFAETEVRLDERDDELVSSLTVQYPGRMDGTSINGLPFDDVSWPAITWLV